jgi:hypothetical protein
MLLYPWIRLTKATLSIDKLDEESLFMSKKRKNKKNKVLRQA